MAFLKKFIDVYSLQARLRPALLAGMPAAFALAALLDTEWWNASLVSIGGTVGFTFLLAQMSRHLGKRVEKRLFEKWGGLPSVMLLRHRDQRLDRYTKQRYHANVAKLTTGLSMPTESDEANDPVGSDAAYKAATVAMINVTRDGKKFPLLFQENINYGFCRNMLGLKFFGVSSAIVGIVVGGHRCFVDWTGTHVVSLFGSISFLSGSIMLFVWLIFVTDEWPKTPAFAYADRLFEASDALTVKRPSKAGSHGGKP